MSGRFYLVRVFCHVGGDKIAQVNGFLKNCGMFQPLGVNQQVAVCIFGKIKGIVFQQFPGQIFLQQKTAAYTGFGFVA